MKKMVIAVLATISCLTAIGQTGQRPLYFDDYLFPRYMASGCYDTSDISKGLLNAFFNPSQLPNNETIIAQPFFIDSSISIKGIGAFVYKSYYIGPIYDDNFRYLQIRDSSLNNVLAQIRYDTIKEPKSYVFVNQTSSAPYPTRYIEVLFDSAINVTSSVFYVTMTFSTVNKLYDGYNYNFGYIRRRKKDCNNRNDFPVLIGGVNGGWRPLIQSYIENSNDPFIKDSSNVPYEMMVFPILNRQTSSLSEINIDDKIDIYPNPAKDDISFSCSFMIKDIEIYDIMGRRVLKTEVKDYSKTINISSFAKGSYVAKLNTEQGLVSKKFIVE